MERFELVHTKNILYPVLILVKSSDSLFDIEDEISSFIAKKKITGVILFDTILHSGNGEERFISAFFEKGSFSRNSYHYVSISKGDNIRAFMCEYLRNDPETLANSGLLMTQQKLISNGIVI